MKTKNIGDEFVDRDTGWLVLDEDERREFLRGLTANEATTEIERLYSALLRAARFSHAKDFSHHGVTFEECDRQSCAEARADLESAKRPISDRRNDGQAS